MTRERAAYLAPFIKAFGEGKTIQMETPDGKWINVDSSPEPELFCWRLEFVLGSAKYRIKPEPREFWIYFNKGTEFHDPTVNLGPCESVRDGRSVIRMREVLE